MIKRTPEQYAIEHAEYLANAAERFLQSFNDFTRLDTVGVEISQTVRDNCLQTLTESFRELSIRIYEFRKRAARVGKVA